MERDAVAAADVERAADCLVELNANYYSALLRGLSDSQKTLVLALVQEPTREFDEEYRNRHDLPASSTVHSALKELIKDAVVEDGDGRYSIGDPILSRYVQSSPGKANP